MKLSLGFAAVVLFAAPSWAATCESLASLPLKNTTITMAQPVAAGEFVPPGKATAEVPSAAVAMKDLPAFCRVAATLKPTEDSDIKIEVWLPASGWNHKLEAVGNGGWAGAISYGAMAQALHDGYATSSTDTGHVGATGKFVTDHPEKLIDFGYRAVHEMTVKAKSIIDAFYGSAPRMSYWNGCSTGGRQGLKEAQRFPEDYDGIVAGASANPRTHLSSWQIWLAQGVLDPNNYMPPSKYPLIHQAVLQACDAADGVKDGLIEDPTRCHFDPKTIECKSGDQPTCLTAGQVEAAETNVHSAPRFTSTWSPAASLVGACWLAVRNLSRRQPDQFRLCGVQRSSLGLAYPKLGSRWSWRWPTRSITTPSMPPTPTSNPSWVHGGKLLAVSRLGGSWGATAGHCQLLQAPPSIPWEAKPRRRIPFGCSWSLAWDIAGGAKDPTRST